MFKLVKIMLATLCCGLLLSGCGGNKAADESGAKESVDFNAPPPPEAQKAMQEQQKQDAQ